MKQREQDWKQRQADKAARLKEAASLSAGKRVAAEDTVRLLEAVIRPFDWSQPFIGNVHQGSKIPARSSYVKSF